MNKFDTTTKSWFSRWITSHRSIKSTVVISLLLLSLPIIVLLLDNAWNEAIRQGFWRPLYLPSVITLYILVISPILARSDAEVPVSIRPIIQLDDEQFLSVVKDASKISLVGELIAFGAGFTFGILMSQLWLEGSPSLWLGIYVPLALGVMFGLLGWVIYNAIASTRLTNELQRLPMTIDIFDISPFDPIGRQSFVQALVFVGGISLSMIFGLNVENIYTWQTWLFYLALGCVPVVVFFLNMREAHHVLATEKKQQLEALSERIQFNLREIQLRINNREDLDELAPEFNALVAYEARLKTTRTWPYNTAMLRTVFVSILFPLLIRGISSLIFDF